MEWLEENPRRPPKQWMRDCVRGASRSSDDPGAVCGALWYHKLGPAQRRAALAREGKLEGNPVSLPVVLGVLAVGAAALYFATRSSSASSSTSTPAIGACAIDLDTAFKFSKKTGYNVHYKTDSSASWGPPPASEKADKTSRWFSQADCAFAKWNGTKWVPDDATNKEFVTWANANIVKGHPGELFML